MSKQAFTPKKSGAYTLGGTHDIYEFPNGYSASVICTPFSYGGDKGLFELAVMHGDNIVYDTPITDDVLGWLSADEVQEKLAGIDALPERTEAAQP